MQKVKTITSSSKLDFLFIYCPLWFPLTYLFLIFNFPSISSFIFIASIFLFAETHFASTWLFFLDKDNLNWIKKNIYQIVVLPIYILLIVMSLWFLVPSAVLIIHYLASGFHVTRQSLGISKISKTNTKISSFLIYFVSGICLLTGLIKPGIFSTSVSINNMNLIIFFVAVLYFLSTYFSFNSRFLFIRNLTPILTGISIYLPLLFFDNLGVATVIGVGMHWCQYIILMFSINLRKNKYKKIKISKSQFLKNRVLFILFYSLIMTSLTYFGMPKNNLSLNTYSLLYLIPLLFQLYHFYIDGFIWKFSDDHIKSSVGKYIFQKVY